MPVDDDDVDLYDATLSALEAVIALDGDVEGVLAGMGVSLGSVILGAVERHNPLPRGTYWVDVPGQHIAAFQQWMRNNRGPLKILASETSNDGGELLWVKFEVVEPVQWEGPGLPTIIKQGERVTEKADTSTGTAAAQIVRTEYEANPLKDVTDPLKPIAKNIAESASDILPSKWWLIGGVAVAALIALTILTGNVATLAGPVLKRV